MAVEIVDRRAAYYRASADERAADALGFHKRYVRGVLIQRGLLHRQSRFALVATHHQAAVIPFDKNRRSTK